MATPTSLTRHRRHDGSITNPSRPRGRQPARAALPIAREFSRARSLVIKTSALRSPRGVPAAVAAGYRFYTPIPADRASKGDDCVPEVPAGIRAFWCGPPEVRADAVRDGTKTPPWWTQRTRGDDTERPRAAQFSNPVEPRTVLCPFVLHWAETLKT